MPNEREKTRRENVLSYEFKAFCKQCKFHSNPQNGNMHFCEMIPDNYDQFLWRENPPINYKDEKVCPLYLEFVVSKP